MNISGFQIEQLRPSDTADTLIFTAHMVTEITGIVICETSGTATTFRIFHDDDGSTFSTDTTLWYDAPIAANETIWLGSRTLDGGFSMKKGGTIGVQSGAGGAINFTLYGHTNDQYRAA